MNLRTLSITAAAIILVMGCKSTIPDGAEAVTPFDIERYMGKWYEVARLDFKQERDLNNVSATYTLNDDGTVHVLNRGYNYVKNEWEEAEGKAKFVGPEDVARLKVSFFGPFYSGYNVIGLDPKYQYALVAGEDLKYLWLLSRSTSMPKDVRDKYLNVAEQIGYNTSDLVWVEHDRSPQ